VKRYLGFAALLGLLLCAMAWAQADQPAPAPDPDTVAVQQAVTNFFDMVKGQDQAGLTAAIASDAQILLAMDEPTFPTREEFVALVAQEDVSGLAVSDIDCRVMCGLGFVYGKLAVHGGADGFFYAVMSKQGEAWVANLLVVDPFSASVPEADVQKAKDLLKQFGDETAEAVKKGSLQPTKDRINPDHAVMIIHLGQMPIPPAMDRDSVMNYLAMAETQMAGGAGGANMPLVPTGDQAGFPTATYVGNGIIVMWAEPTASFGPAQEAPLRTAIIGLVSEDKLSIVAMAMAIDMDMGGM
jgi:hypothetical protein